MYHCSVNKAVGRVVFENTGKAQWGCTDRTLYSNWRGIGYFACLSGRSYPSRDQKSNVSLHALLLSSSLPCQTRRTKEEVGRQHPGMDRLGVRPVPEGSGEQGKMEKTGCKIICGAPTTLAVKELMMMMMLTTVVTSSSFPVLLASSHHGLDSVVLGKAFGFTSCYIVIRTPASLPPRGGDVTVYVWHKPTERAHSFLFCSCVYFCLYGTFNCILFHTFSKKLSVFSLCSSGLNSAISVLSIISLYESLL